MRIVVNPDPVYRRRRAAVGAIALLLVGLLVLLGVKACAPSGTRPVAATAPASSPTTSATTPAVPTQLVERRRLTGAITPRSVAASSRGLVLASNMMYTHTVTAYDAAGSLVATIPDAVTLADFGVAGHPGRSQGAPVDAAFTPDGAKAYVSNYSMTGSGFGAEPSDRCATDAKAPVSYLYRVDATTRRIDQVIAVGAVPKDVVVTPDSARAVVANWCSGDLSVVETQRAKEAGRVTVGDHPRGLALSRDGRTAYVLAGPTSGAGAVLAVDLEARTSTRLGAVGPDARDIAVAPDGSLLVSSAGDSTVRRLDPASGAEKQRVTVPRGPRSLALSPDGATLYVVSYDAERLSALRVADLTSRSVVATPKSPTGLTVEPTRKAVWVAGYTGTIGVYDERPVASGTASPSGTPSGTSSGTLSGTPSTGASGSVQISPPAPVGSASAPPVSTPTT